MNRLLSFTGVFGLALVATGCVPKASYKYVPTTSVTAESKSATCKLELFTTRPERPYDELGVLEPSMATTSVSQFLDAVSSQVCMAGGDAVITEVNGSGHYMRGTVLRFRAAEGATAAP